MTNLIAIGPLRIATLDPAGSGSKTATYFLPPPDGEGGITLNWIPKGDDAILIDGSELFKSLGYLPELKLKYKVYDDLDPKYGYTIGSGNGDQLDFASLLTILSTVPGYLKVSPGPNMGGFVVNKVTVSPFGVAPGNTLATGVQITLRGKTPQATQVLGVF